MRAFSLVELSIVLVILGLLTGGILAGQSLIRAAELRSVGADMFRFRTAHLSFHDRYMAMAGDMANATKFWGDDAAACADAAVADGTPGTCNGNGNGIINQGTAIGATAEAFQYWKQLVLAGLIEGTYTGLSGPSHAAHAVFGTNAPASRLSPAGFAIRYLTGSGQTWVDGPSQIITFGIAGSGSLDGDLAAIRAEEAWNIDSKFDDGKPATGFVRASPISYRPYCTTADTTSAAYALTDTHAQACSLFFFGL